MSLLRVGACRLRTTQLPHKPPTWFDFAAPFGLRLGRGTCSVAQRKTSDMSTSAPVATARSSTSNTLLTVRALKRPRERAKWDGQTASQAAE